MKREGEVLFDAMPAGTVFEAAQAIRESMDEQEKMAAFIERVVARRHLWRLASLVGLVVALIAQGIATALLWRWYVHPLGIPPLTWWHGIGIALIVDTLWLRQPPWHPEHQFDHVPGYFARRRTKWFISATWVLFLTTVIGAAIQYASGGAL